MGANQSGQHHEGERQITVVNKAAPQNVIDFKVPPKTDGILPIKKHSPKHRLNPQHWVELIDTIEKFSATRAELVATRQSKLQEKITHVDQLVQGFTDLYVNVKHQALTKMNEDCKKVDDLTTRLQKCNIQCQLCLDMLNKLNFLLPDDQKLEPLDTI